MNKEEDQNTNSPELGNPSAPMGQIILVGMGMAIVTVSIGWAVASMMGDEGIESLENHQEESTASSSEEVGSLTEGEISLEDKKMGCELVGGEFNEYGECLGIDEMQCDTLGGEWEACGSACRHDPDAELCTMQCVQFCQL